MPVFEARRKGQGGFPPPMWAVTNGIAEYRHSKGLEPRGKFPYNTMQKCMVGREFEVGQSRYRISAVRFHEIAPPLFTIGDVEMMDELTVAGIASAVAARPFLGGKKLTGIDTRSAESLKKAIDELRNSADGAATRSMRSAFDEIHMRGIIKGGEGGGRDQLGREASLFMCEPVGTGYGPKVDLLVDPLEITKSVSPLTPEAGEYKGGSGWAEELNDPENWFPGYSGSLSLMAAANASGPNGGFRALTSKLFLNRMILPWQMELAGINLNNFSTEAVVKAAAKTFGIPTAKVRAAAMGKARHRATFNNWIEAGMKDENIFKPTDGDSMFPWSIAAGLIHFAGLTGGVMEGLMGALPTIPIGCTTGLQFVSRSRLSEAGEKADLLSENDMFEFSEAEQREMVASKLFDGLHIGTTLRNLGPSDATRTFILNSAANEVNTPGFSHPKFLEEIKIMENPDPTAREGVRFSEPTRTFLTKIFGSMGWWDVRRPARIGDLRYSLDTMFMATALTPNRWSPLLGIKYDTNKKVITAESMFVGGSQAVFVIETDVAEVA